MNKSSFSKSMNRLKSRHPADITFDVVLYICFLFVIVITAYPFLHVIAYSFNDAIDSLRGNIYLLPREFTLYNYQQLFEDADILLATVMSIVRTVVGSAMTVFTCLISAYALSRKEFVLRKLINGLLLGTMFFSGGFIPYFLLMRDLNLTGTFWVYIFPALFGAWNIIIIKSYMVTGIPEALIESAKLDGASDFTVLFRIVTPLSTPVLATVVLWVGVNHWNSWFDVYLYNGSQQWLSTLQFELQKILQQNIATSTGIGASGAASAMGSAGATQSVTPQAIRSAMTIVATVPILISYPFLQKYFVSGLTLGGVKD